MASAVKISGGGEAGAKNFADRALFWAACTGTAEAFLAAAHDLNGAGLLVCDLGVSVSDRMAVLDVLRDAQREAELCVSNVAAREERAGKARALMAANGGRLS